MNIGLLQGFHAIQQCLNQLSCLRRTCIPFCIFHTFNYLALSHTNLLIHLLYHLSLTSEPTPLWDICNLLFLISSFLNYHAAMTCTMEYLHQRTCCLALCPYESLNYYQCIIHITKYPQLCKMPLSLEVSEMWQHARTLGRFWC